MKHGRGIVNVRVSNLHVISPSSEKDCSGHPLSDCYADDCGAIYCPVTKGG